VRRGQGRTKVLGTRYLGRIEGIKDDAPLVVKIPCAEQANRMIREGVVIQYDLKLAETCDSKCRVTQCYKWTFRPQLSQIRTLLTLPECEEVGYIRFRWLLFECWQLLRHRKGARRPVDRSDGVFPLFTIQMYGKLRAESPRWVTWPQPASSPNNALPSGCRTSLFETRPS
jgi:hypothetical protein